MIYDWFKIYNATDFLASGLVSREISFILPFIGKQTVLITRGNLLSILYNGVFLSVGLNDKSPFYFDSHAVMFDSDSNLWLGILHAD